MQKSFIFYEKNIIFFHKIIILYSKCMKDIINYNNWSIFYHYKCKRFHDKIYSYSRRKVISYMNILNEEEVIERYCPICDAQEVFVLLERKEKHDHNIELECPKCAFKRMISK